MNSKSFVLGVAMFASLAGFADERVWLDELDLKGFEVDYGVATAGKSVDGNPLKVGGKTYAHGVGAHANSSATFRLDGKAISFEAKVGLDAEVPDGKGSVEFRVLADGVRVYSSGHISKKDTVKEVKVDLAGVRQVELVIDEAFDSVAYDHADWVDALFTMKDGTRPAPVIVPPGEQLGILTPAPSAAPRINGAKVFGVRPGHPILWRLPVSGARPIELAAANLPAGVRFDPETQILSGAVAERGEHVIAFTAENAKGRAAGELKLVVGDTIALTPPMGWNSWNVFAHAVTEKNVRDTADRMIATGLADHGWSYVNIDDFWQNNPTKAKEDPTLAGPDRLADGTIATNKRFPDMKGLADYVHAKGLKIGLYSSPGPLTCGGCIASWKHEWQDAKTYAEWGYDYLKYDWCSYGSVALGEGHARFILPYRLMGEALAAQNRDIVFSLCQYGMDGVSRWGASVGGQCWRTTGDITDSWGSLASLLKQQVDLWPYARPGAWNDPDMLIVGMLGWGNLHPTKLTPNEQYTHMSMWCILCSPLLIGCDLTQLDDFTLSLLTNDEVIETNQDPLGAAAARVVAGERSEIWAKPMSDGSVVLALVNLGRGDLEMTADLSGLGMDGKWRIRDLWRQTDAGTFAGTYSARVLSHATQLVRCWPVAGGKLREGLRDIRDNWTYSAFEKVRPVGKPGFSRPN